jgi:hypothetical protein
LDAVAVEAEFTDADGTVRREPLIRCWGVAFEQAAWVTSVAIWADVLRVRPRRCRPDAAPASAELSWLPCICEPACDNEGEGRHAARPVTAMRLPHAGEIGGLVHLVAAHGDR